MLGVFAIIVLVHVCLFVAGRQQVGLLIDRVLYLQGRVDQLEHEVKTLVETIGALQRRKSRKSRRRDGSRGGPDHSGDDMQDDGVSMPLPSGEATKFHVAESESESRMRLYRTTSPYETEGGNRPAAPASSSAQARAGVPEITRVTSSRKNATSFNDRHTHDAGVSTPLPWGKATTSFNDDSHMHDAGISMPMPNDEEVKFDAEPDESESERAAQMKVKGWLQAVGQLPETPVVSSALDKGVKGGRVTTVSGRTSNSDLHANKTPASSNFDKPRAGRHQLYMAPPYEKEGGIMPAAPVSSSAQARARVPEITRATSSRKNATSFNDDRNISKSYGSLSSLASSTATTAEAPQTPRARKTAAAKGVESKTSSGSRFYSYVIEKATRAAQRTARNHSL